MNFPIIILCGGMATRLLPLTERVPKSLIIINNKPFIYWQLKYLESQGFKEVILCLGHLSNDVEKYCSAISNIKLKIKYSYDGDKLLGTGGATIKASSLVKKHFFLMYGDSYLPINFSKVEDKYINCKKDVLMTIYRNKNNFDQSNVQYEYRDKFLYNKKSSHNSMQYIDYGLLIFNSKMFADYKKNINIDLSDILNDFSKKKLIEPYEIYDRFYEIGSKSGLSEFNGYIKKLF